MPGTPFAKSALKGISFDFGENEKIALVGHTGSGKSTLLQHLNGLIAPTEGRVIIDGVDICAKKPSRLKDLFGSTAKRQQAAVLAARRKVGMVFQYPERQLFEETVYKDVAFGLRAAGNLPEDEIAARVKKALSAVGLNADDFAELSPFSLSGGQMRRVAIAGVLVMKPKYLILDEPTSGLDPLNRALLTEELTKYVAANKTAVMLVTHSMDFAASFARRILVIRRGELVLDGSPAEVFREKEILSEAGLMPPHMMRLLSRLKMSGLTINDGETDLDKGAREIARVVLRN